MSAIFIKKSFLIVLANASLVLASQNLLCQKAFADNKSITIHTTTPARAPIRHTPVERGHTVHRASIGIATLHVYTKVTDLKSDSLFRHLLRQAVGADSPDSNPDAQQRTAAELNLDINETMTASLIRKDKFDLDQMADIEDINEGHIVLGNLTKDNIFHLSSGNALFLPKRDIIVLTDLGEIHISAGSMVGILKPAPDIVSIYDLEDGGGKKVSIKVDNELLTLSPGKHMVLSKQVDEFEKVNPAHRIAYRRLEHKTLPDGIHVYTTEFSISSAVLHIKPLQNILLSDDKEDRKLTSRILKNFVILEDVFGGTEPYKMPASIVAPVKISTNLN